ncbi:ABC transporter ATP-binding protein [Sulfurovum sp. zt1-1]|uniref:ABC transporter ATP-binding protein n=1 Tax=Sulfurovum zhangzhouensis TaxID=3019067 RepID=A0ABT7QX03_9BACT|nr:ABC transporter ATP-binding protein [Sulfurovum zhangzhouensis]MDM5271360.1 ABC transporter ATP-binding protein [Sulfurovum zhangzhouensis]
MTKLYSLKRFWQQILGQKKEFWATTFYGMAATLLLLPIPMLIPLLIDEVLLGHPGKLTAFLSTTFGNSETWFLVLVTVILVAILRMGAFVFSNQQSFYAIKITQRISYLLRHRILHHLERVCLSEYETLKSGGVVSKTIQDVTGVSSFASAFVSSFFSSTLMLIGIAAVMLWMNWVLALLILFLNPFFLAFSKVLGKKTGELLRRQYKAYEVYNELLNETLELFIQVRASNQEKNFFALILDQSKEIENASIDYGHKAAVAQRSSGLLTNTVIDIFRALGVVVVAYSDLSVGMMIAFLFYLSALNSPVQQLMGLMISYQNTKPAIERINALLKLKQEPHYPHEKNPFENVLTTSVTLKDVSFAYQYSNEVLSHINIEAKSGQKIALIGPSGSGKSTIAQILVGLYRHKGGEICYNGVPIEQIGLPVIRENVALMLQESLFFNETIRMNLTLSKEISDEKIHEALRAAKLETFVLSLENGLESRIGKNGIRLSGGQKQRLAIARLILSNPKVVIFDEATSALDNETEHQLYETLEQFLKERTTIIIAHRTTTIKQADYIYLIEEGRVKAEGSYEELFSRGVIKEDMDLG